MNIIRDFHARRGKCLKIDVIGKLNQMNMRNLDVNGIILSLCDNGYLCEEDDNLIIM